MKNKKQKSKTLSSDEIRKLLEEAGFVIAVPVVRPGKKLHTGPTTIYREGSKKGIKI